MKAIKYISATLLIVGIALSAQAQVVKKKNAGEKEKETSGQVTDRMKSLFEEKKTSDSDLQWQRTIYRSLDLNKEERHIRGGNATRRKFGIRNSELQARHRKTESDVPPGQ